MDMGVLPDFFPGGVALNDTATIKERFGEGKGSEGERVRVRGQI